MINGIGIVVVVVVVTKLNLGDEDKINRISKTHTITTV